MTRVAGSPPPPGPKEGRPDAVGELEPESEHAALASKRSAAVKVLTGDFLINFASFSVFSELKFPGELIPIFSNITVTTRYSVA